MKRKETTPVLRPNGGKLMAHRNNMGWWFIAPFLIGFLCFYAIPLVQSLIFSFNDIKITGAAGYELASKGLDNYHRVIFVETDWLNRLLKSIKEMFLDTVIVVPFSFFSAIILAREFKGRGLARAIFFLPVVMSTGVLAGMDNNDVTNMMMARSATEAANSMSTAFSSSDFVNTLLEGSMPESVITFMTDLSGQLYDVIIKSGLQIIMFMSGINTISPSIYESSSIEGATAWENFWKITFPMCGPYLLLNAIYTIIDSFTNISNPLIYRVKNELAGLKNFGMASAAMWLYFIVIALVLGIAFSLMSKRVFYND